MSLSYPILCALAGDKPSRLSQAMHNAGFRSLGLPYAYVAFDTTDTKQVLTAMRVLGIRGMSLTIPHKEAALSLVDSLSEEAQAIGAINTVLHQEGKLIGYNTDCYGIERSLDEAGFSLQGRRVLVLGAGGAARAAVWSVKKLGAREVVVANRHLERARSIGEAFGVTVVSMKEIGAWKGEQFELLIQATPLGSSLVASDRKSYGIDLDKLSKEHCVFDFVTKETFLTIKAREAGATVIQGVRMLLFQAERQFELFTGQKAPLMVMEQALDKELG